MNNNHSTKTGKRKVYEMRFGAAAKWMFNYSFGKHLKALKKNIDALEEEK